MTEAVLFDLDGTLLPLYQNEFLDRYFSLLAKKLSPYGYESGLFIKTIKKGVNAMMCNDGSCTNEEAFWREFTSVFGKQSREHNGVFDEFYRNEFQQVKDVCRPTPKADEIVKMIKCRGCKVILATNPLFPRYATESRIRWAGMDPADFDLISTFDDFCVSKPNPDYFREVLRRIGLNAEDCIMVGNDVDEDMVAESIGMKTFLLTDCVINRKGADISHYAHGGFDDLKAYLNEQLSNQ